MSTQDTDIKVQIIQKGILKLRRLTGRISDNEYQHKKNKLNKKKSILKNIKIIENSSFFDAHYYLSNNLDLKNKNINPAKHYLITGYKEGREPSAVFNGKCYFENNPDVVALGINPLLHYEKFGKHENRLFTPQQKFSDREYQAIFKNIISLGHIKSMFQNDTIKIVSFDIFDTLLVRPAIYPKDIFHLIAQKVDKLYNINFIELRHNAEEELGQANCSLEDIYCHIQKKHKLSYELTKSLMTHELDCEMQLLHVRHDLKEIYDEAVRQKKKIIAISDMYIASDILLKTLHTKGYTAIEKVFVSNEYKKRKDTPDLYEAVFEELSTKPQHFFHIGDNYHSDYLNALKLGVTAVHYPKITDIVLGENSIYKDAYSHNISDDPMCRILMGFTFNYVFGNRHNLGETVQVFHTIEMMAKLYLAPMVLHIAPVNANLNHLILKELFSLLTATCTELHTVQPIIENIDFSEKMLSEMTTISSAITEYADTFMNVFAEYKDLLTIQNYQAIKKSADFAFNHSCYNEEILLENIIYSDAINIQQKESLCDKLLKNRVYQNVFSGTGFDNPNNIITMKNLPPFNQDLKTGIHIHLYNIHLYTDFIYHLKDFPVDFDLFITITEEKYKSACYNIFNKNIMPNLQNICIKITPNRGRDVAPWIVGLNQEQRNYDIFCHLHTKESKHLHFGHDWREYLLKNLISYEAFSDIHTYFSGNLHLGCIFPQVFPKLKAFCIHHNIPQEGDFDVINIINHLITRMNINKNYERHHLFFSEGTMMWYRPKALQAFFDIGLTYQDFPQEPISACGTIAHAIERLPAFVCQENGYLAKFYTKFNK